jgi:AbrB family looped-hinge helix DNA binding protein
MAHNIVLSHNQQFTLSLGARGRLVLPASVRSQLALREGDTLVLVVEPEGTMRLAPLKLQAQAVEGMYRSATAGRNLVDELIAERRNEAAYDEKIVDDSARR